MPHVHIFTETEAGVDICTDCPTVRRNPATADQGVTLPECKCGRGLARFLDGDRTPNGPLCATCLAEGDQRKAVA